MQTKAFKSGNSLAVRIPKDLAIFEPSQDVIIERKGDTLVLRAAERTSLADLPDIFALFPKTFMAEGRLPQDQDERDWGDRHVAPSHAVHEPTIGQDATASGEIASSDARKKMPPGVKRARR